MNSFQRAAFEIGKIDNIESRLVRRLEDDGRRADRWLQRSNRASSGLSQVETPCSRIDRLLQAERDQKADHARIKDAIKTAETEIAALKKQKLDLDEMQIAIVTIRDQAILAVRDVRKNMTKRAGEAKSLLESLTDDFFRQRLRLLTMTSQTQVYAHASWPVSSVRRQASGGDRS